MSLQNCAYQSPRAIFRELLPRVFPNQAPSFHDHRYPLPTEQASIINSTNPSSFNPHLSISTPSLTIDTIPQPPQLLPPNRRPPLRHRQYPILPLLHLHLLSQQLETHTRQISTHPNHLTSSFFPSFSLFLRITCTHLTSHLQFLLPSPVPSSSNLHKISICPISLPSRISCIVRRCCARHGSMMSRMPYQPPKSRSWLRAQRVHVGWVWEHGRSRREHWRQFAGTMIRSEVVASASSWPRIEEKGPSVVVGVGDGEDGVDASSS